jgi:hypothetical protein
MDSLGSGAALSRPKGAEAVDGLLLSTIGHGFYGGCGQGTDGRMVGVDARPQAREQGARSKLGP